MTTASDMDVFWTNLNGAGGTIGQTDVVLGTHRHTGRALIEAPTKMRILNAEKAAHLAAAIDPQYSALVYTGCRIGGLAGLAGLRLGHLDLGRRHLTVADTLSDADGKLALTPSAAPRRLALPRFLVEELRKYFALWPPDPDGPLFTAPHGGLLRHSSQQAPTYSPIGHHLQSD